jgi:hypothetical protein
MYQLEIATCLPEEYVNCVVILIIVFVISVVYRVLITWESKPLYEYSVLILRMFIDLSWVVKR